jgi:glc operon protein GlcG
MRTIQEVDYSEAKRVIDLIVGKALQAQKAMVVAVADSHGELICFTRMDGAPVSSIRIAMNKPWTAARARKPTLDRRKSQASGERLRYRLLRRSKIRGLGRGIPVWKNGEVAGAVAVSGLSSAEDVGLANSGAELITHAASD